jgi:hypothetical protein
VEMVSKDRLRQGTAIALGCSCCWRRSPSLLLLLLLLLLLVCLLIALLTLLQMHAPCCF